MAQVTLGGNKSEVRKFLEDVSIWVDGCWHWLGGLNKGTLGYGCFYHREKRTLAHRYMWELMHDQEVPVGMVIMHTCDNPLCVNPEHLKLGTQNDNVADMIRKDRAKRFTGEHHPNYKVTEQLIKEARRLKRAGHTVDEIAAQLELGKSTVGHILNPRSRYTIVPPIRVRPD